MLTVVSDSLSIEHFFGGVTKLTLLFKVMEVNDERSRGFGGEASLHHHLPSTLQALPLASADVSP